MSNPLVSIIIPVYNGSEYLGQAIDSALAQTYNNVEILVVNDGSSDNGETERIALSYGESIRYFHKENGGVSTALNLGIDNMRGEYFSWLSHDDLYTADKIAVEIETLRRHGDMTAIVHSDYVLFTDSGDIIASNNADFSLDALTNSVCPIIKGLVSGCSLLIHRSHFEVSGRFDPALRSTQDYKMWFDMFRGKRIVYVDKVTVKSRVHGGQGTKTYNDYTEECARLYKAFSEILTAPEKDSFPGGASKYYFDICNKLIGYDMEAFKYVNKKFLAEPVPDGVSEGLAELEAYISSLSKGNASRIVIFCAGMLGIRLYHALKSRLIRIDCFADNDPAKHGYLFDGIRCVSREALRREKDSTLVIVANQFPEAIVRQLREDGFAYVTTKQEMDGYLDKILPLKWVSVLESVELENRSSKDAQSLISQFDRIVYDICKYYEDRLSGKED